MLRNLVAAMMSFSLVVGASLANHTSPAWAENQKPEDKSPQVPKPDTPNPDTPKPDTPKPDTPKPDAPKPEDKSPQAPKPDAPKPDSPKPDTPKPEDKSPQAPKPEPSKPDDKKPDDKKPEAPKPEEKKPEEKKAEPERRPASKAARKESKIKPFDEIITSEAKSDSGLMTVHRLEDKIFYEIPTDVLGKDILWVTQIEKTGAGNGYGGSPVGDRVVRWEQRNDDILLRDVNYDIRADTKDPIKERGRVQLGRADHRRPASPGLRQGQGAGG